jgi:hypothetical protein
MEAKERTIITNSSVGKIKKRLLNNYKSIIKRVKIEINRLSNEINEYIKTINGFEDFIIESILFIKDRDNLISSHICNLHKNRILALKAILDRVPSWSINLAQNPKDISVYGYKDSLIKYNEEMTKFITNINKSIEGDIEIVLEYIPQYIQNINIKLLNINKQRAFLEALYLTSLDEYKNLKSLSTSELKSIIIGENT